MPIGPLARVAAAIAHAACIAAMLVAPAAEAQKLPSVEWIPVGYAGTVLVEYTRSGLQRTADGTVVAFSRSTLVDGIEDARRQRIEALRAAGLSARGYERYLRQMRRSEYDCAGARVRALSVTDYDAGGTVLAWASTEGQEAAWAPVPAGTIGRKLLEFVCVPPRAP